MRASLNDFPGYLVIFVVGDQAGLEDDAHFARNSLNQAGLDCRVQPIQENSLGGRHQDNMVYIAVGRKG
jgi:hypothetical protein